MGNYRKNREVVTITMMILREGVIGMVDLDTIKQILDVALKVLNLLRALGAIWQDYRKRK